MRNSFNKILRRFITLQKQIAIIFIIAFISIILIEVWFKEIESPFRLFYTLGNIFISICYSLLASTVFYFINQHIPKEEKIVKASQYITKRMMKINREIHQLQRTLALNIRFQSEDLAREINFCCEKINPNTDVNNNEEYFQIFNNWYEYLDITMLKFIIYLDDIIPHNEGMNIDLYASLLNLKDSVREIQYKLMESFRNEENLTFLSIEFQNLLENHLQSHKLIRGKYYLYYKESTENQDIENEKREQEKNEIQLYKNKKLDEHLQRNKLKK